MTREEIKSDISLINKGEFITFYLDNQQLELQFVFDIEEEHPDEDDCCCGFNGSLFSYIFTVKYVNIKGSKCDSYTLDSSQINPPYILLEYKGKNLSEDDGELKIEFEYENVKIIDEGQIASCPI